MSSLVQVFKFWEYLDKMFCSFEKYRSENIANWLPGNQDKQTISVVRNTQFYIAGPLAGLVSRQPVEHIYGLSGLKFYKCVQLFARKTDFLSWMSPAQILTSSGGKQMDYLIVIFIFQHTLIKRKVSLARLYLPIFTTEIFQSHPTMLPKNK